MSLACAIALSSACVAAEDNAGHQSSVEAPFIVAAETGKPKTNVKQPTAADKAALANQIQQRYKPRVCTQSSGQIKACSVACSAALQFFPVFRASQLVLGVTRATPAWIGVWSTARAASRKMIVF